MSSSNANSLTALRQTPLTCSGHTRPVVFLAFSDYNEEDSASYYMISACKGNSSFTYSLIAYWLKFGLGWTKFLTEFRAHQSMT